MVLRDSACPAQHSTGEALSPVSSTEEGREEWEHSKHQIHCVVKKKKLNKAILPQKEKKFGYDSISWYTHMKFSKIKFSKKISFKHPD